MFAAKKNWLAFSAYIILLRKGTVGSINKLYLFLSTLITVLQMPTPWNCLICSWFGGLSLRAVLMEECTLTMPIFMLVAE